MRNRHTKGQLLKLICLNAMKKTIGQSVADNNCTGHWSSWRTY